MFHERLETIVVIVPARILLKHMYKPRNLFYRIRFALMSKERKNNALLALADLGCLTEKQELNIFGTHVAELVIEEDKRYWVPNILSIMAILFSVVPYLISWILSRV